MVTLMQIRTDLFSEDRIQVRSNTLRSSDKKRHPARAARQSTRAIPSTAVRLWHPNFLHSADQADALPDHSLQKACLFRCKRQFLNTNPVPAPMSPPSHHPPLTASLLMIAALTSLLVMGTCHGQSILRYSCHKKAFRLFHSGERTVRLSSCPGRKDTSRLPVLLRTFYDMFVKMGKAAAAQP